MSNAVTKSAQTALTMDANQTEFSNAQVAALNQLGVEDASREDLAVFFHQAKRTGLDPFARQIYMIGRRQKRFDPQQKRDVWETKQTIQTGIDGFRLIARRAVDTRGESLSSPEPLFCGPDGQWTDVWLKHEPPAAAKVQVVRNGQPFVAVALFREYAGATKNGDLTQMWKSKASTMIAKCAEALALRKAFPQDLSGLYTADEMQQADNGQPAPAQPQPAPSAPSPEPAKDAAADRLTAIWDDPAAIDSALPWLRSNRPELAEKAAARLVEFEAADNTETEGQTSIEDAEIVEDTNE